MGGSTNTVLHGLAIAHEAGVDYPAGAPQRDLAPPRPASARSRPRRPDVHIEDVDRAGGISAILKELSRKPGLLHLDGLTVTGGTLGEAIAGAPEPDRNVIRTLEAPFTPDGGLAVLFGNLAPQGAVVKSAGVDPGCFVFEGEAVVFEGQDECLPALAQRRIQPGQVVVIRYEGPQGGPGHAGDALPHLHDQGAGAGQAAWP